MPNDDKAVRVRLTLVKSLAGQLPVSRACARGLGLRRIGQSVERSTHPAVMGMVDKIAFMLRVERL